MIFRREMLVRLGTSLTTALWATPDAFWSTSLAPSGVGQHPSAPPHGFVIGRNDKARHLDGKASANHSVDWWSLRVSDIELNESAQIGRIYLWDEIFSEGRVIEEVRAIINGLLEYYEVDPTHFASDIALHVEGLNDIGTAVSAIVKPNRPQTAFPRIALIDIDSCGVSKFDWHDVIPSLRLHYDIVVGIARFAGRGPSDILKAFETGESNYNWTGWETATLCDFTLVTTDALLGLTAFQFRDKPTLMIDEMSSSKTCCNDISEMINRVIPLLSSEAFRNQDSSNRDAPVFAMGESHRWMDGRRSIHDIVQIQRDLLSQHFADAWSHEPFLFPGQFAFEGVGSNSDIWLFPLVAQKPVVAT